MNGCSKLDEPFVEANWADNIEAWFSLLEMLPKYSSERSVRILEGMFLDTAVNQTLALAKAFMTIDNESFRNSRNNPFLRKLKRKLGNHIKFYYHRYENLVKVEIAYINKIREYKQRVVGLIGSLVLALMIGVANFFSNLLYNKYKLYWEDDTESFYESTLGPGVNFLSSLMGRD